MFNRRRNQVETELQEMLGYVETNDCRRAYILHYFGEEMPENKTCCDNDFPNWQGEIVLPAKKIADKQNGKVDWEKRLRVLFNLDEK